MSAHVLSIVLNELRNRDKMQGLPSILSFFRNKFNKGPLTVVMGITVYRCLLF